MSFKEDFKENKWVVAAFWLAMVAFLGVCAYYMIHNAAWRIEDEVIVTSHTGMGKAFSVKGFVAMAESYGRLFPFAYNLYNVLLLFHDGYISPTDHYILQAIALVIYALAFAAVALLILRKQSMTWKYAIAFCFVAICVARVYPEFITCYTGAWIIFMFLPIFLWAACKFNETEKWVYGIVSLLVINYINYCYETLFIIPLAMGACSLLFSYKKLSKNKRLYGWLLVASGLLFLALYAIIVLPRAKNFYGHYTSDSVLQIAYKIFIAQKIYWIAVVVLVVRTVELFKKKSEYTLYDSMLLAAFAYYCGAAFLKLDFTYYYNIGSLTALVAILFFLNEKLKAHWLFVLMACIAAFYCRKIPTYVIRFQKERVHAYTDVSNLSKCIGKDDVYWYAPEYEDVSNQWVDLRGTTRIRLEIYLSWLLQQDIQLEEKTNYDNSKGIWLFPAENKELFPDDNTVDMVQGEKVFSARGITGYRIQ